MIIEEVIKQKAENFISNKFSGVDLTVAGEDFVQDKINDFMTAVNIGIELGMKDGWIDVNDHLPDELETVWITNGKGWTTLGCWSYFDENEWCWAETNGTIYQDGDEIVAECESGDLDVKYWHRLPKPIKV